MGIEGSTESTDWIDRLQNMLIEKALHEFDAKYVSFEVFSNFLKETTYIPKTSVGLARQIYEEYLKKINETGELLTWKVN